MTERRDPDGGDGAVPVLLLQQESRLCVLADVTTRHHRLNPLSARALARSEGPLCQLQIAGDIVAGQRAIKACFVLDLRVDPETTEFAALGFGHKAADITIECDSAELETLRAQHFAGEGITVEEETNGHALVARFRGPTAEPGAAQGVGLSEGAWGQQCQCGATANTEASSS